MSDFLSQLRKLSMDNGQAVGGWAGQQNQPTTPAVNGWSQTNNFGWTPTGSASGVGNNNSNGLLNIQQSDISKIQAPANNMGNWLAQLMKLLQGGRY